MIIPYKDHTVFAFSDTHGMYSRLIIPSETDILICAGDGVEGIEEQELSDFFMWFAAQPARLRIFVAGNHELLFDLCPDDARLLIPKGITLLEDSGIKYDGINFYSVAARPWLHQKQEIPSDIDFLVTHGPVKGILDEGTGCSLLKDIVTKYKPHNHVFGHIHSCGNQMKVGSNTTSYYERDRDHYGIKIGCYYFCIYMEECVGYYCGEDSCARYPEFNNSTIIESYDLKPILGHYIGDKTLKELIDNAMENYPPYAGEWYTSSSAWAIYRYLDILPNVHELRNNKLDKQMPDAGRVEIP